MKLLRLLLLAMISPSIVFAFSDDLSIGERKIDHRQAWGLYSDNQGSIGSCHTFSFVQLLEYFWWKEYGEKIKLSKAYLFSFHYFGENQKALKEKVTQRLSLILDHDRSVKEALAHQQRGNAYMNMLLYEKFGIVLDRELRYSEFLQVHFSLKRTLVYSENGDDISATTDDFFLKQREYFDHLYTLSLDPSLRLQDFEQKTRGKLKREWFSKGLHEQRFLKRKLLSALTCAPVYLSVQTKLLNYRESGNHTLLLIGYNPKNKKYRVKNSWSNFHSYQWISEEKLFEHLNDFIVIWIDGEKAYNC